MRGSAAPASELVSADVAYTGDAVGEYAGVSVAGPGDVDGDGYADLLMGGASTGAVAGLVLGGGI